MENGDIGEQCERASARLANGIHGDAISLQLYRRVMVFGWLSQLKTRERNVLLRTFKVEKVRRVRGKLIHGCLDMRTMVNRYNCVRMKEVKKDLRGWFGAIVSLRMHAESRFVILRDLACMVQYAFLLSDMYGSEIGDIEGGSRLGVNVLNALVGILVSRTV